MLRSSRRNLCQTIGKISTRLHDILQLSCARDLFMSRLVIVLFSLFSCRLIRPTLLHLPQVQAVVLRVNFDEICHWRITLESENSVLGRDQHSKLRESSLVFFSHKCLRLATNSLDTVFLEALKTSVARHRPHESFTALHVDFPSQILMSKGTLAHHFAGSIAGCIQCALTSMLSFLAQKVNVLQSYLVPH